MTPDPNQSSGPAQSRRRNALTAFLEAHNIFWGELVGGLLFVGCSIALVITLWARLSENPIFKFCTFVGADAALFGAGLYTLRRWKLASTSHGLLLIAALLAPLTFLGMTVPTGGAGSRLDLPMQLVSLGVLCLLMYRGGRVLVPTGPWLLTAAVVCTSACQLLASHLTHAAASMELFLAVGLTATAAYSLPIAVYLFRVRRDPSFQSQDAKCLLMLLGIATFSLAVTLGLHIHLWSDVAVALGLASVMVALTGLTVMAGGLVVHRGLASEPGAEVWRVTGTAVALSGMTAMLLAIGLAWPRPLPVLSVCILNCLALTVVAFRCRLPAAHVVAIPCLTVGYLVGYFLLMGRMAVSAEQLPGRMLELVLSAETGTALLALFLVVLGIAEILARTGHPKHGGWYELGGVGLVLLSLSVVTLRGLDEPGRAALVYGIYGGGVLAINGRWWRKELTYLGLLLLTVGVCWALWWQYRAFVPEWGVVLAGLALGMTVLGNLAWWRVRAARSRVPEKETANEPRRLEEPSEVLPPQAEAYAEPLTQVGPWMGWAALALAVWAVRSVWPASAEVLWAGTHALLGGCLTALWAIRAVALRQRNSARLAGCLFLGTVAVAAGWLGTQMLVVDIRAPIALGLALASGLLTTAAALAGAKPRSKTDTSDPRDQSANWFQFLAPVGYEVAALAFLPALVLAAFSWFWPWHCLTFCLLSATALLLAWIYRAALLTWLGSALVLGAITHVLVWGVLSGHLQHSWLLAVLAHSTLALLASLLLSCLAWASTATKSSQLSLRKFLITPLTLSALVSSCLAVPQLLREMAAEHLNTLSLYAFWLAGVWAVVSWRKRWPLLFAAFQVAVILAALLACADWLTRSGEGPLPTWTGTHLPSPAVLQIYALTLALVSVLWALTRLMLRSSPVAQSLLNPSWPAVDRVLLGLLLPAQLLVAVQGIVPGIAAELAPSVSMVAGDVPTATTWTPFLETLTRLAGIGVSACGSAAWVLLGLLFLTLVLKSRQRITGALLLGLLALGLTIPVLVAGQLASDLAVSSALRWGLGGCFVLYSLPLWLRGRLTYWAARLDSKVGSGVEITGALRWLLIGGAALPVILLTLGAVTVGLAGYWTSGPRSGTFFAEIGRLSTVIPLVAVCLGLVGHALREQSPGYAFTAGLGLNLGVSILVRAGHRTEALTDWWILLAQANIIITAAIGLLWLTARRHLYGERRSGMLLFVQVVLGPLCNAALLAYLAGLLLLEPTPVPLEVVQGGGPLGWLALVLTGALAIWFLHQWVGLTRGHLLCVLALATVVMATDTTAVWAGRGWLAYQVLTVGCVVVGVLPLLVSWLQGRRLGVVTTSEGGLSWSPWFPADGQRYWVGLTGFLAVALALRGAVGDTAELWWSAGVVIAAAGLIATVALWQRRESWVFVAGLGLNLAVSLVLWQLHQGQPWTAWWVELVQANSIVSSAVAMGWLAVSRHLYGAEARRSTLLLNLQVLLGLLGNGALLIGPAVWLIAQPAPVDAAVLQAGQAWGWLALLGAVVAASWHVRLRLTDAGVHLLGSLGLAVGVLAACTAATWDTRDWLAYHVLTVSWIVMASAALAVGWRTTYRPGVQEGAWLHGRTWLTWVLGVCLAGVGLALRGAVLDPGSPWWPAGTLTAIAVLVGGVAAWQRREGYVLAGGLILNLAVSLVLWRLHSSEPLDRWWILLVQGNLLAGAVVALVWRAGGRWLYDAWRAGTSETPLLGLQVGLVLVGNGLLLAGPAWRLILQPGVLHSSVLQAGTLWGWLSLLTALTAGAWHLRLPTQGRIHLLGGFGLTVGVLASCTAANLTDSSWLAYHIQTIGWMGTAAAILACSWLWRGSGATLPEGGKASSFLLPKIDPVRSWVAWLALVVVALALHGVTGDPTGPWWSAGAVLGCGVLAGIVGLGQRRALWVFVAGLALNLAVSLVIWDAHRSRALEHWWVTLIQANTLVSAVVAMGWVDVCRRLYGHSRPTFFAAPLLGVQVGLGFLGNVALLLGPAVHLILEPGTLHASVLQAGSVWGWLTLLLALPPAVWYLGRTPTWAGVHVLCGLGLTLGVLAACTAGIWQVGDWLAYHVLVTFWALTGLATLTGGLLDVRRFSHAQTPNGLEPLFPTDLVRHWVKAICLLLLGLALRATGQDPDGNLWPAAAVGVASLLAGGVAVWQRRQTWAFTAGLGFNLAVSTLLWDAYRGLLLSSWWVVLLQVNVITASAVALLWLALFYGRKPGPTLNPLLRLQVLLGFLGSGVLTLTAATWLVQHPGNLSPVIYQAGQLLGWLGLGLATLATMWSLRGSTRFLSVHLAAILGLMVGVLAACSVSLWDSANWLPYHTLTTFWAIAGAGMIAWGWVSVRPRTAFVDLSPEQLARQGQRARLIQYWVSIFAVLVLALALRGVGQDPTGHVWSASAALAVGLLMASMSLWQQREVWVLVAGATLNLAASLLLWDQYPGVELTGWWRVLLQVNVVSSAVAALLWLAISHRLYGNQPPGPSTAPLLTLQVVLGLVGNLVLLLPSAVQLVLDPGTTRPSDSLNLLFAWSALLGTALVSGWYTLRSRAEWGAHLLCALILPLGILVAITLSNQNASNWFAYHALLVTWAGSALGVLGVGWMKGRPQNTVLPSWLTLLSLLVLGLALRGVGHDPTGPWWPSGAVLAVGLLAGARSLWEQRESWMLAAGLTLNLAVSLVFWDRYQLGDWEHSWIQLVQVNLIASALVTLSWLLVRQRLYGTKQITVSTAPLLVLQLTLGVVGNLVVLAAAAILLIGDPGAVHAEVRQAGGGWGWAAFVLGTVPAAWHFRRLAEEYFVWVLWGLGLAVGVLAACTTQLGDTGNWLAYHILTTTWVLAGAAPLVAGWFQVRQMPPLNTEHHARHQYLVIRAVGTTVVLVGFLVLRGLFTDPTGHVWSASAMLGCGVLAAALSLWLRHERWALSAGLAVNLALSLLVWDLYWEQALEHWWVRLVQVNVLASAAIAFLWLVAYRHLYPEGRRPGRLLSLQVALGLVGNAVLLASPAALLILRPEAVDATLLRAGEVWGWLALLLSSAATVVYFRRTAAPVGVHLLCALMVAFGVLLACSAAWWDKGDWLAYHVLMGAWTLGALIVLVAGWWSDRRRTLTIPVKLIRVWVTVFSILVACLALRTTNADPLAPWFPAGGILAISMLFAALAYWQQHEGWAVASGVGVNLAVSLVVTFFKQAAGWGEWCVWLVQVNVISSAATTLVWLAVRRQRHIDRPEEIRASPLLSIKIAAELSANALLLVWPITLLVLRPGNVTQVVAEAGDIWGWLALLMSLGAATWCFRHIAGRFGVYVLCGLGLTLGALSACTVADWHQEDWLAYHVLTGVWALTGLATAIIGWRGAGLRVEASAAKSKGIPGGLSVPVFPPGVVRSWVLVITGLVGGLALRGVGQDPVGPWGSVLAVVILSVTAGVMAGWRQSTRWAFASGLGLNLAVSLVLWHGHRQIPIAEWWVVLLQGNLLATATGTLVWLAVWQSRHGPGGQVTTPALLSVQVFLGLGGNALLLVNPVVWLCVRPDSLHTSIKQAGEFWGGLALFGAAVAALWYTRQNLVRTGIHTLCGLGLAIGVYLACLASRWDDGQWLAYHVLMISWALTGGIVLAVSWLGSRRLSGAGGKLEISPESPVVPAGVGAWVAVFCVLVTSLALRGLREDPSGSWWLAGAFIGVSLMAGAMALWQRREGWAFAAGLGINLAVSLLFWELAPDILTVPWLIRLIQVNAIACAIFALLWLAARWLDNALQNTAPRPLLAVQVMLSAVANGCLLGGALWLLITGSRTFAGAHLWPLEAGSPLAWLAWSLTGASLGVWAHQRGKHSRFAVIVLLALGGVGQLACTLEALVPTSGYRVLMLGWASVGIALGPVLRRTCPPRTAAWTWAAVVGCTGLAVFLACKDAAGQHDLLWAAGAVTLASVAWIVEAFLQRRESWTFAGGLGFNAAVSLLVWHGNALWPLSEWSVLLLQANLITSAVFALFWLGCYRGLYRAPISATPLLTVQVFLPVIGNVALLLSPAYLLLRNPFVVSPEVHQAGTVWGWLALSLALLSGAWYAGRTLTPAAVHLLGVLSLTLGVLAACTASHWDNGNWLAYHTLMAAWACVGVSALVAGSLMSNRNPTLKPELQRTVADMLVWWVVLVGMLLVSLVPLSFHADPSGVGWWVGCLLTASALAGGLALWRCQEVWAFVASLGLNATVVLLLGYGYQNQSLEWWLVEVLQVSTLTAALAALPWLAVSQRLYSTRAINLRSAPFLTLQVGLCLAGNLVLLVLPAGQLVQRPIPVPVSLIQVGSLWGWLAFLTTLASAGWYIRRIPTQLRIHCLGGLGVAFGVLVTGTAAHWDNENWLAYHTLLVVCVATGALALTAGWLYTSRRTLEDNPPDDTGAVSPSLTAAAQGWVLLTIALAVCLALRGVGTDPTGNAWAAGIVFGAAVLAAATALWRTSEVWAFLAAAGANLALSLVVWEVYRDQPLTSWWVHLVQINTLASSASALLWLSASRRLYGSTGSLPLVSLLTLQVLLGLLGNVALLAGPLVRFVVAPGDIDASVVQAGHFWGWLALGAALVVAAWYAGQTLAHGGIHVLCSLGLVLGVLSACTAAAWDTQNWLAYHTLMVGWTGAALLTLVAGWVVTRDGSPQDGKPRVRVGAVRGWVIFLSVLVVGLALRSTGQDVTGATWPCAAILMVSALAGALALWSCQQQYVYASGLLISLASGTLWYTWAPGRPDVLALFSLLSLATGSAFWSVVELSLQARTPPRNLRGRTLPYCQVAAGVCVVGLAILAGLGLGGDYFPIKLHVGGVPVWVAVAATTITLVICLRDPTARLTLVGLYFVGLSAVALGIHETPWRWLTGPGVAFYVLLTLLVWRAGPDWLGGILVPGKHAANWPQAWFLPIQTVLVLLIVMLSGWDCLTSSTLVARSAGPLAVAILLPALFLMANGSEEFRRTILQHATLGLGAVLAAELGWFILDPTVEFPRLHLSGLLLAAFTPLSILYGMVLPRLLPALSGWHRCSQRSGVLVGFLALVALAGVLAQEALLFRPGLIPPASPPSTLFVVVVTTALILLVLSVVCFALIPGLDPLQLSERGRTGYVYAGELLAALIFLHLRLTAPYLFRADMEQYWTYFVVGIAFLGAAAGEAFRRLDVRVLAEPLERTGVFLPLVPVLGFWANPAGSYALLWFLVGLLYVFLSLTRRSLGFTLLALVAANVGLWAVLYENQFAFLQHPQLWLIPFALSVLVAEWLNRDRLSLLQRNTIRYLALTVVYLSSSAEIILTELEQAPFRPLVLVGLALLGVFLGMLLRVKAFLFLGTLFLLLGIVALIRHAAFAAADQGRVVWLVAGGVLGLIIFILFAVFERRQNEILRLLRKLKDWE